MSALKRTVPRDRTAPSSRSAYTLAYPTIPLQSAYCGAKFRDAGFTDSVRTELMHDGSNIWITMVQLLGRDTPQLNCVRRSCRSPAAIPQLQPGSRRGRTGSTPPPARDRRRLQLSQGDLRRRLAPASPTGTWPEPAIDHSGQEHAMNSQPGRLPATPTKPRRTVCTTALPGAQLPALGEHAPAAPR